MKRLRASCVGIALLLSSTAAIAQTPSEPALQLNEKGYFEGPAVNVLAFSNWYDGLFADAKISGIEIIQLGMRSATNGDVRLSATPGQWDAIGALVGRKVDAKAGVNIDEFASSDYVGEQNLPFAGGMTMKDFLGFKIFSTSAITAGKNIAYHTSAVGLGINADVSTEINYVPEKAAHLATSMMSMGAVVINDEGVYELLDNN